MELNQQAAHACDVAGRQQRLQYLVLAAFDVELHPADCTSTQLDALRGIQYGQCISDDLDARLELRSVNRPATLRGAVFRETELRGAVAAAQRRLVHADAGVVLIAHATLLGEGGHRFEQLAVAAIARQHLGSPFAMVAASIDDQTILFQG